MATAITAIFGANSTQFQAELAKMQTMAIASAGRIRSATAGGGHGAAGMTGMVRETTVIGREIAQGRGMGRILASLTLLTQYIGTASRAAKQGASAAATLAEAYEKEALKADIAAIAAARKSAALAEEAEMEGFETMATLDAADACAIEADAARAAALALRQKATAAATDAAAQEALAASSATAGLGMWRLLGVFALMMVIIGEAYVVFRGLAEILGRTAKMQLEAAKYANEHTLAIWEEIEAAEKLKDATEKTTEAIHQMNIAKDQSVELARQAIEASNEEAAAREKLYDASVKSKQIQLEISEKLGLVTNLQAINQKASIESQAVSDKAALAQKKLDDEAEIAASAAAHAQDEKAQAQKNAESASDDINKSPEGMARAAHLAELEKSFSAAKSEAEQAKKDEIEFNNGGANILGYSSLKSRMEGFSGAKDKAAALHETATSKANAAATAEIQINSLKRSMMPNEKAAAEALRIAQEKTSAATELGLTAKKAATAAGINAENTPAQIAAQQRNIELSRQLEILSTVHAGKGYEMNSQQKVGAYAATPPEFKQMADFLRIIAMQTHYLVPQQAPAPGHRPPQHGTIPQVNSMPGSVGSGA